ncbi:MAG: formate dehydrogenase subunit gamma [Rhodospirillales bacterium]|nr:formate dehydrogenase subunit gamma [Rhodospirillales bacterium]
MSRDFKRWRPARLTCALFAVCLAFAVAAAVPLLQRSASAETEGRVPGNASGNVSDAEIWRQVRQGVAGSITIPDTKAAVLAQSEGDNWRSWRNGPIAVVGAAAFWVMFFVVLSFHNIRGPVRLSHGRSGRKILRFSFIERFAHWLTAGSFIVLAITGVNMIYGRFLIMPLIGRDLFATLTQFGKYIHNYVAFAFMAGLLLIFFLWVRDNLWDRYDWGWIKKGGGLLFKTEHPPAAKFNFGQKTMFWAVIIGGTILSVTGLNLLFPFAFFDMQQMQWIQAIHGTVSQVVCMLMVAHIYIGTVGMEEAFTSMSTGYVDENWAKDHHKVWLEEIEAERAKDARTVPAGVPGAPAE